MQCEAGGPISPLQDGHSTVSREGGSASEGQLMVNSKATIHFL